MSARRGARRAASYPAARRDRHFVAAVTAPLNAGVALLARRPCTPSTKSSVRAERVLELGLELELAVEVGVDHRVQRPLGRGVGARRARRPAARPARRPRRSARRRGGRALTRPQSSACCARDPLAQHRHLERARLAHRGRARTASSRRRASGRCSRTRARRRPTRRPAPGRRHSASEQPMPAGRAVDGRHDRLLQLAQRRR